MPSEKKSDEPQDIENKPKSEPKAEDSPKGQASVETQGAAEPKPEEKGESDQKPVEKSQAKTETEPDIEKDEKKQGEDQGKEKEAAQPERQVRKPAVGELDYYSEVRNDLPELRPGDVIRVSYRVIEGGKERIQVFEGTVIALKNSGISRTITVRKTSFGISVERIFPLNSKLIQQIQIKKHSKVRRAKLYYLRKLKGKAARLKELR